MRLVTHGSVMNTSGSSHHQEGLAVFSNEVENFSWLPFVFQHTLTERKPPISIDKHLKPPPLYFGSVSLFCIKITGELTLSLTFWGSLGML